MTDSGLLPFHQIEAGTLGGGIRASQNALPMLARDEIQREKGPLTQNRLL